jgi:glyoxylase-like metal-dependent hydrolase (beta-lactamase superfamily II)
MTRSGAVAREFAEIADQVYVLRYPVLDVNATLVLGGDRALLVDTLSTDAQASELAEAVRRITAHPLILVNTHHHYDHCFGNARLAGPEGVIWAHEAAAAQLRAHGARQQREAYQQWVDRDPRFAAELSAVTLLPPNRTVHRSSTVEIGGRGVELHYFGRGHTEGDLVVEVPDAGVVITGDLVEQGAPPDFTDGYPLEWPDTLAAVLARLTPRAVVVPGHGAVVDAAFVQAQHVDLSRLDWLIRDGHADRVDAVKVAANSPFGQPGSLVAVRRGYAELTGDE